MFVVIKCN